MPRRIPRWSMVVAALPVLYAALGFLVVPWVAKSQLEKRLPAILHRASTVREVRFNPFAVSLTLRGFSVLEKDGSNFVSFDELYVDVAFLKLVTGKIAFEEISLRKPAVGVALLAGGKLSFADLIEGGEPKPKSDKPPPAIYVTRLRLDDGSIAVADLSRKDPVRLRLAPLNLHLDNFSTEPAKDGPYSFTARMDPDTLLRWEGNLSVNPLRSSGKLEIENVALASFAPYAAEQTQLRLAGGLLTLRGNYKLDASATPLAFQLDGGLAELKGLRLDGPGDRGPLVQVGKLAARGVRFDLAKKDAGLEEVALEGGHLRIRRERDASIELQRLAGPPPRAQASSAAPPAAPPPAASPKAGEQPFHVALKLFRIAGLRVDVEDLVPAGGAKLQLSPIDLSVGPLEWPTAAAIPLSLSVGLNERGLLTVKGSAKPSGAAEVDVQLAKIELPWGQPYVAASSNARLQAGTFGLQGHVVHTPGNPARTTFTGGLGVDGLSVYAPGYARELLGLERFALEKVSVALPPNDVRIGRVLLRGLRARVQKNADRTFNLDALSKSPKRPPPDEPLDGDAKAAGPAVAQKQKPKAAPPTKDRYAVGTFAIENSLIEFADRTVAPPFAVKITQLAGKAVSIAYPTPAKTHFDFSARVDAAPWRLTGDVHPKGQQADLNAVMSMKGWDLIPTTGHALKGTGYPVEKGKFSLDVKYKVVDRKLEGENMVVIDQLTLGEHRDVPGATGLPVKLALAILTDRHGTLTVDLPVSGDLDDPSFSFGRIIWATVKNLLVKVATSPFALLGALAGGSDDLSAVEFPPGKPELSPEAAGRLQKLGKVLIDRPALRVEVQGKVDAKSDGDVLRRAKLEDRIAAELRAALPAAQKDRPIDAAAREAWIRAAWTRLQAQAGKPADGQALPPLDAMEADLAAREQVTAEELTELASERAEAAQEKLLEVEGLTSERVFVTAPKLDPGAGARTASMSLK